LPLVRAQLRRRRRDRAPPHPSAAPIAKINKPQAVGETEEIICIADTVLVALGDEGIELVREDVPIVQKPLLRPERAHAPLHVDGHGCIYSTAVPTLADQLDALYPLDPHAHVAAWRDRRHLRRGERRRRLLRRDARARQSDPGVLAAPQRNLSR
jgi:hypothetical protein